MKKKNDINSINIGNSLDRIKTESIKTEPIRTEQIKPEPIKTEPINTEPIKPEPIKTETYLNKAWKTRETVLHLTPDEMFDLGYLYNKLIHSCKPGQRYSVITRVCFRNKDFISDNVTDWKSLGDQIRFSYDIDFKNYVYSYVNVMRDRLSDCMELYDFKESELLEIQILLYKVYYTDTVVAKENINLKSLGVHKELVNVSKINKGFKYLPLTLSNKNYGDALKKDITNNVISNVILKDGSALNLKEHINKHLAENKRLNNIDSKVEVFQTTETNNIVTVEEKKNPNENSTSIIDVYDPSGLKIHRMEHKQIDNNTFTRKIGNVEVHMNKNGVYNKIISQIFSYIYPNKILGYFSKLLYTDNRIGTLDLETYKDKYNISKTYAIGFYVKDWLRYFYIKSDLDSDDLIMSCIDSMLVARLHRYTIYVHNLGNYDSIFLLKVIIDACIRLPDKYQVDVIVRNEIILSILISKKVGNKTYNIKIVDSYNFLSSKLSKLCKTFKCDVEKGIFPYRFVTSETLFYLGKKPDINFYEDIDVDDLDQDLVYKDGVYVGDVEIVNIAKKAKKDMHKTIQEKGWSTKEETLKYLEKDLISLFDIMDQFKLRIFTKYYTHITRSLTISGLAMDIFLRRFYDNNIPLINKKSVYNDIKKSYYGGVTEVYKPYGKNLYYYDVNSLYPHSALNPMPGLKCSYIEKINLNISEYINDMFGFYYCKVKATDGYLGLLPYRIESGLLMPIGEYEGWYFSEELKFAFNNGYDIQILKGYKFEKTYGVFDKYIDEIYRLKSNTSDPVERQMAKSLLNNLLGRFGMNIDKSKTELVDDERFNELIQYKQIKSVKHIGNRKLVTYGSNISLHICESHDVDFTKTYINDIKRNKKGSNEERLHDVSIAISSAVTSYSRIFMSKIKLEILKTGSIYYTDTDSIVTDVKLGDKYVGNEIGKLKLEHEIKEGYFISNKTYCFKNNKNKLTIRAKGIDSRSLCYQDFVRLYLGIDIEAIRSESVRNFSEGYVNILVNKTIVLSANSYTKREKKYIGSLWSDTKPLVLPL